MSQLKDIIKDIFFYIFIIILSLLGSWYIITKYNLGFFSSIAISLYLHTLGYVILTLIRIRENISWRNNVLPTFSVFHKSLANCLVLLSSSRQFKDAYENKYFSYKNCSDSNKYKQSFVVFLEEVAPIDFMNKDTQNGELPLCKGIDALVQNILIPIRDLLRWGMLMDRLHVLRKTDCGKSRLGLSLMELVVNLCIVECQRTLNYIRDQDISYNAKPLELNSDNIAYANIGFTMGKEYPFYFDNITKNNCSEGARRLIINLNEMSAKGIDLSPFAAIPDYPYCINTEGKSREFIELYLTIAWFRSVMDCIGWKIVCSGDE